MKNVHVEQMTDSDASKSILGPEGPSQQAVSEHEDVEEASDRPEATQEDPDEDWCSCEEEGPHRRRADHDPGAGPAGLLCQTPPLLRPDIEGLQEPSKEGPFAG